MKLTPILAIIISLMLTAIPGAHPVATMSAAAACTVSGVIDKDTIWAPASCDPYIVGGNVQVNEKVTLTIQPGTTLKFNKGFGIEVRGTLEARGMPTAQIVFTSNQVKPTSKDWKGLVFANTSARASFDESGEYAGGSVIQYAVVEYASVDIASFGAAITISNGAPYIDHCIFRNNDSGGIYANVSGSDLYVTNNQFSANSFRGISITGDMLDTVGVIHVSHNTIRQNHPSGISRFTGIDASGRRIFIDSNIVDDNSTKPSDVDGISIDAEYGTISNNIVTNNIGAAVRLYHLFDTGQITITGNLIADNHALRDLTLGNNGGIQIASSQPLLINANQISGNTSGTPAQPGNLVADTGSKGSRKTPINATDNDWGTTDKGAIEASIRHYADDSSLPEIKYEPFRSEPIPAPLAGSAPALIGAYLDGAPGSVVRFSGGGFPAGGTVTLAVNGQALGEVQADASGTFDLLVATDQVSPGRYRLLATAQGATSVSAGASLSLSQGAPLRPKEGTAQVFALPTSAVPTPTPGPTPTSTPRPAATAACDAPSVVDANTTLSPATCNPYIAKNGIIVRGGATLTIDSGTTIKFGAHKGLLLNQSGIVAHGTAERPITLTSNAAAPAPGDWQGIIADLGNEDTPITISVRYAVIEYAGGRDAEKNYTAGAFSLSGMKPDTALPVEIDHSTLRYNQSFAIATNSSFDIALRITNNTVENNEVGGISCSSGQAVECSGNTISGNGSGNSEGQSGHAIKASSSQILTFTNNIVFHNNSAGESIATLDVSDRARGTITGNLFYGNTGIGPTLWLSVAYVSPGATVTHNTIANNNGGGICVPANNKNITLSENSIFGNIVEGHPQDLEFDGAVDSTLDAQNNYWGVTSESDIEEHVRHIVDDTKLGLVKFAPFLSAPPAQAPPLPIGSTAPTLVDPNLPELVKLNSDTYEPIPFDPALLVGDWLITQGNELLTFHSDGTTKYISPLVAVIRYDAYTVSGNRIQLTCLPESNSCMWWDSFKAPTVEVDAYLMRSKANRDRLFLVLVGVPSGRQVGYGRSSESDATAAALAPSAASAVSPITPPSPSVELATPAVGAESTAVAAAPANVQTQPTATTVSGGAAVAVAGPNYLPFAYWGLFGLLALLWGVELTVNRRRVGDTLRTVFQSGASRVQQIKLTSDRTGLEKQLAQVSADLGKSAWEQQVTHPAYIATFEQLGNLSQQRTQLRADMATIETQIQQESTAHSQAKADYAGHINAVQEQKKAAGARLSQTRAAVQAAEKQLGRLRADQQKVRNEIQSMGQRLDQLRTSTVPDRDAQAATLTGGIAALEQSLVGLTAQEPVAQVELDRRQAEQAPITAEISGCDQQIAQLQEGQRQALGPIEGRRDELQGRQREANDAISTITGRIDVMLTELGAHVALARPASAALSGAYARIDQIQQQLGGITSQIDLLNARQAGVDRRTLPTFIVLVMALLGTVGVVVAAALGMH
jgi:hypothetical protein